MLARKSKIYFPREAVVAKPGKERAKAHACDIRDSPPRCETMGNRYREHAMSARPVAARATDLPVHVGTDYPAPHDEVARYPDIGLILREDAGGAGYFDTDGRPVT